MKTTDTEAFERLIDTSVCILQAALPSLPKLGFYDAALADLIICEVRPLIELQIRHFRAQGMTGLQIFRHFERTCIVDRAELHEKLRSAQ